MLSPRTHEITHPWPVFSGFTYFLMGPAHWIHGAQAGRRRKLLATQLAEAVRV